MSVSFEITPKDSAKVSEITARAAKLWASNGVKLDRLSCNMDLTATNSNGCPLDFDKLLAFPDADFAHDIGGIARHLDRNTGKLGGCFLPRCAKAEA